MAARQAADILAVAPGLVFPSGVSQQALFVEQLIVGVALTADLGFWRLAQRWAGSA